MSVFADLCRAIDYAAKQHKDQRRKNAAKTPYINHPIEVMNLISNSEYPIQFYKNGDERFEAMLMAAVLHDTVEDTGATEEDINLRFGCRVASIVMECTDDKSLPKVERKKQQIEHATHISFEAKFVKMADKYSNLSNLLSDPPTNWSKDEVLGYFVWSFAVCREIFNTLEYPKTHRHTPGIRLFLCNLTENLKALFKKAVDHFGIDFMNMTEDQFQQQLETYYKVITKNELIIKVNKI